MHGRYIPRYTRPPEALKTPPPLFTERDFSGLGSDFRFLLREVGPVLVEGVAWVVRTQPQDPFDALGRFILDKSKESKATPLSPLASALRDISQPDNTEDYIGHPAMHSIPDPVSVNWKPFTPPSQRKRNMANKGRPKKPQSTDSSDSSESLSSDSEAEPEAKASGTTPAGLLKPTQVGADLKPPPGKQVPFGPPGPVLIDPGVSELEKEAGSVVVEPTASTSADVVEALVAGPVDTSVTTESPAPPTDTAPVTTEGSLPVPVAGDEASDAVVSGDQVGIAVPDQTEALQATDPDSTSAEANESTPTDLTN